MKQRDTSNPDGHSPHVTTAMRLRSQRNRIVDLWKDRTIHEVSTAKEISQHALIDSLPILLERIAKAIDEANLISTGAIKNLVQEHAEQRINTKAYSIDQVIHEYHILRETILKVLEEEVPLPILERDIILHSIDLGVKESTNEFLRLKSLSENRNKKLLSVQFEVTKILSEASSKEESSNQILRTVCEYLDWQLGVYWEIDKSAGVARCSDRWSSLGINFRELEHVCEQVSFTTGVGLPGRVWETGSPVWVNDISRESGFPMQSELLRAGLQSAFALPIFVDNDILGIMEFFSKSMREDDRNLLTTMTVLGGQIGQFVKRKRSEAQAVAEKLKFESLFTESPAAMALLRGPTHIFEKSNSFYNELIGHRDIIGKTVIEAVPEVENERFIKILDEVFSTGIPYYGKESQIRLRSSPEGPLVERYLDFTYLRINDKDGLPYGVFVHAVDVTEKVVSREIIRRANEELVASEKQSRDFIEAMPQMAFVANSEGEITYYNQQFYDYVGIGKETEGWGWMDRPIHHPDDLQRTIETWDRSIKTGTPYEIEYRLRRYDGQYRWHLGRAIPVKNDEGMIVKWLGTNTDIEDQKRVVIELEKERSIREQFVATLSHDLRNPLSAAKTSAEMVIRSPDNAGIRERAMSRIISAVDRSDKMIRNLLDANMIQAGKKLPLHMQECDLSSIAEEVIEEQRIIHGNRFILKAKHPQLGFWSSEGIRRIIDNLVGNAVKYGSPDTEITVTVGEEKNQVFVSVHNYGNPIPPEDQKNLFQAFRRSISAEKSASKGWGLGLTLVKGLVEAHGGSIHISSSEEAGTTFEVKLPKKAN